MKKQIGLVLIILFCLVMAIEINNTSSAKVVNAKTAEPSKILNVVELDREQILEAEEEDYAKGTFIKWKGFFNNSSQYDINDGIIPIERLDDDIFLSMNLPSESRSEYMINANRDNGHILSKMQKKHKSLVGIGAIYQTAGETLPEKFTLCLGKIKTFVYLKSVDNWIILDEQPYPSGVMLYELPWTNTSAHDCKDIKYYNDHIEVQLTAKEFEGNVLHFWGTRRNIDYSDVLYIACAYEFWIKGDETDFLTATIGCDAKDAKGSSISINQIFTGRGLSVTNEKKTHWGHTIPNEQYDVIKDGYVLKILFDKWWGIYD